MRFKRENKSWRSQLSDHKTDESQTYMTIGGDMLVGGNGRVGGGVATGLSSVSVAIVEVSGGYSHEDHQRSRRWRIGHWMTSVSDHISKHVQSVSGRRYVTDATGVAWKGTGWPGKGLRLVGGHVDVRLGSRCE